MPSKDQIIKEIEERRKAGFSLDEIADLADVPGWAFIKILKNKYIPDLLLSTYLKKIEAVLYSSNSPIAIRRKLLGWSRQRLADESGVPYFAIVAIEKGGKVPPESLARVYEAVNKALQKLSNRSLLKTEKRILLDKIGFQSLQKKKKKRWSLKHDKCVNCGTVEIKHRARGLCEHCYRLDNERRQILHPRARGTASKIIDRKYLIKEYFLKQRSLGDIAKACGCSRQYIYKKIKEFQIPTRSKSSARKLALGRRKIYFEKEDHGIKHTVIHERQHFDISFFSSWSSEMAWVLGLIYSDGNILYEGISNQYRISISQKEPEILEKAKVLMKSNAKLIFRPKIKYPNTVAGELYKLEIRSKKVFTDLTKIGLKPIKSLDLEFPKIPSGFGRHFIRGLWDGDGSVYVSQKKLIEASYISGSLIFIKGMLKELYREGFPERTIHSTKRKNVSYSFKFFGTQCKKLYHYLYDGVPKSMCLERKREVFEQHFDNQ